MLKLIIFVIIGYILYVLFNRCFITEFDRCYDIQEKKVDGTAIFGMCGGTNKHLQENRCLNCPYYVGKETTND